jgi:hypothetical protein
MEQGRAVEVVDNAEEVSASAKVMLGGDELVTLTPLPSSSCSSSCPCSTVNALAPQGIII